MKKNTRCGVIGKRSNLYIIGVPKREERETREEAMFEEIMAEEFLKLKKAISSHDFKNHCKPLVQ